MFVRPRKELREVDLLRQSRSTPRSTRRHKNHDHLLEEPGERKSPRTDRLAKQQETIKEETTSIAVEPRDLQTTFENLMCVIKDAEEGSFSKATVLSMLESVYEWMVFDENSQIVVPSGAGSRTMRKMWPQGSKIDTRKKKDRSLVESSAMHLKEVDGDYVSTVASSVVSSTLEEEDVKIKKGSVLYSDRAHTVLPNHSRPHSRSQQDYFRPPPLYARQPQDHGQVPFSLHTRAHYTPLQTPVPALPHAGLGQRYSMAGAVVEPPSKVEETPHLEPARVERKKVVRRAKVGASARTQDDDDGGAEVVFAD